MSFLVKPSPANSAPLPIMASSWNKKKTEEMKKKQLEEELAQVHQEFVQTFADVPKLGKTWVKGGVVNPDKPHSAGDDAAESKGPWPAKGSNQKSLNMAYSDTSSEDESSGSSSRMTGADEPPRKGSASGGKALYKPTPKVGDVGSSSQKASHQSDSPATPSHTHSSSSSSKPPLVRRAAAAVGGERKKSNLEIFKEELKSMQEERAERRRLRQHLQQAEERGELPVLLTSSGKPSRFEPPALDTLADRDDGPRSGPPNYDHDTTTTNLYLGNISPQMTEQQLCEVFGKYGPLASVKIMWPRSEEEKARGRHCGFVAFMTRADADRAYKALRGQDIMDYEMRLSWGKAIPIPPRPAYIPPAMLEASLPPPPSGLPFNAQLSSRRGRRPAVGEDDDGGQKTLEGAVVKVVVPTERPLLCLIHRMIEFVVREGPLFEAMIMRREMSNPMFSFLFENKSPAHVYYRWKLFSILQGDEPHRWRLDEFRMFEGGSIWRPPPMNPYLSGMPASGSDKESGDESSTSSRRHEQKKGRAALSDKHHSKFQDMLRELVPERIKIGELMVWCLDHAESAEELVECIAESLSLLETPIPKKIARLFLVSDILHNSSAKVPNASFFRKYFESRLVDIFRHMNAAYDKIESRLKAEQYKQRVMSCFRAWEDWVVYPVEYLIKCQNMFLGLMPADAAAGEEMPAVESLAPEELDGAPLSPSGLANVADYDGVPLDDLSAAAGSASAGALAPADLDGRPLVANDIDGMPLPSSELADEAGAQESNGGGSEPLGKRSSSSRAAGAGADSGGDKSVSSQSKSAAGVSKFVRSKWETVDEEVLKAQVMTTSKWETLEEAGHEESGVTGAEEADYDLDGEPIEEESDGDKDGDGEAASEGSPRMEPVLTAAGGGDSSSPMLSSRFDADEGRLSMSSSSLPRMSETSEERRAKLREIELKVVRYQDEVEAGRRSRRPDMTLAQQVELYRQKLLHKESDDAKTPSSKDKKKNRSRSSTPKSRGRRSRSRSRGRKDSPSYRRSRSRSPKKSKRSRSRSAERHKRKKSRH